MFSMLQTVMQLSNLSLTTSYSISLKWCRYCSIKTCGTKANAFLTICSSSPKFFATPLPCPPKAKPARTIEENQALLLFLVPVLGFLRFYFGVLECQFYVNGRQIFSYLRLGQLLLPGSLKPVPYVFLTLLFRTT